MRQLIFLSTLVALMSVQTTSAGPIKKLLGMQESPEDQLAQVAKDWTGAIRALKIIPVFPLREDITPGDVFLVNVRAEDEAKEFKKDGFLSPDVTVTRLPNIDYKTFYQNNFLSNEFTQMPHSRDSVTPDGFPDTMPRVHFPVFSFKSLSNTSLASAFPIQSIPIALEHLQATSVSGTISIDNARSYGADGSELRKKLLAWAKNKDIQEMLRASFIEAKGDPVFLRIVTQVYLAGGVNVSLSSKATMGASGQAGNPPSTGQASTVGTAKENQANVLQELNTQASSSLAMTQTGGKITFTSATTSSVKMSEQFQRRLVIGYLGQDVRITENGQLGAQKSSSRRLLGEADKKSSRSDNASAGSPKSRR